MGEARWRGRASVLGLQSVCGFVSWVNLTSDYDVGPGCVVFPSSLDREANARRISVYHYTLHSAQNLIKPYILQASSSPHHHQCLSENYFHFSTRRNSNYKWNREKFVFSLTMQFHITNDRLTDWAFSGVHVRGIKLNFWKLETHSQSERWVPGCVCSV